MKKFLLIVAAFGGICSFLNCTKQTNKEKVINNYPNGGSELALLMRSATEQMEMQRGLIIKGESFENYPINMDHILTATPTEEGKNTSVAYQEMAKQFKEHLQTKEAISLEGQIKYFNETVVQCVNCHETQCPGPNLRIKKLYINQ